ncbi:hypothetical protein [Paenibacillus sp. GCM10027626]|uniref:hypothetical protein n=1 Tax=Paenibacillus sp. GCM10027626 TaxID=3273411 RepID=UPI0036362E23
MIRNPIVALLLGVIPGLGHFAVQRKVRGVIYPLLFVGIIGLGFIGAIMADRGEPLIVAGLGAICIWVLNLLDLIIFLLRRSGDIKPHPQRAVQRQPGNLMGPPPPPPGSFSAFGAAEAGTMYSPPENNDDAGERFYTILLSFVPGLGHLQLGLMQRGVTLLIGFFGLLTMIIFVSVLAREQGVLVFLGVLPIIWLYGMFDAVRQLQRKQAGELLVDRSIMEDWDEFRHGGRKSRWFATVLSIIPGAGHMYLGLQKRGLQLMAGFFLSIYLLDALQLSLFLFVAPIIWCYAFFDSLQQQSRYALGFAELQDVPIVDGLVHRKKWLGLVLVLLGLYYVSDRLLMDIVRRYFEYYQWITIRDYLKTGVTAVLLVGIGIKLLAGNKQENTET